jgi:hypothetical protein
VEQNSPVTQKNSRRAIKSVANAPTPVFREKTRSQKPAQLCAVIKCYSREKAKAGLQTFARQSVWRVRQFKYDGLISCLNVIDALLHHVNLRTWLVFLSLTTWANEAGLATRSAPGRKSITRAYRALIWLERFGLVEIRRTKYLRDAGIRLPVFVRVTPLFWQFCGVSPARMLEERKRLCENAGLSHEDEAILAQARQQWREYCEIATADNAKRNRLKAIRIREMREAAKAARKEREARKKEADFARLTDEEKMAFYLAGIPEASRASITSLYIARAVYELYNKPGEPPNS